MKFRGSKGHRGKVKWFFNVLKSVCGPAFYAYVYNMYYIFYAKLMLNYMLYIILYIYYIYVAFVYIYNIITNYFGLLFGELDV